jgi:polyribonucleotide nucleotidyltransferase
MIRIEREIQGKKIVIETGRVAKQANGSVLVSCGDTVVLVTACLGGQKDYDFLPLTIDYVEKTYAAGKIPGGYFKREGKLSEHETLTSRLMDRPCRPLFPEGFNYEVQIVATVLSASADAEPDVLAVCGASAAVMVSDIPFDGPLAGVRVARVNGKLVINPSRAEKERADLAFIVAGTSDAIVMVEGGANQVPEAEVLEALFFAHKEMQTLIEMQNELRQKVGKEKIAFTPKQRDAALVAQITEFISPGIRQAVRIKNKKERKVALSAVKESAAAKFVVAGSEDAAVKADALSYAFEEASYNLVREISFNDNTRIDGRDFTTVRDISIEVGFLPRTHGSSLFTRGETQGIVAATLGLESEAQYIDTLLGPEVERKHFMLHYNFPPFSVGETKPMRGPGRREIGHGALAERALRAVMPEVKEFPYAVRLVSEITESNGSSSMATVCGGSLAMLDAGVPLKAQVAGVAMGLMKDGDKVCVLTDILGDEDHLGDMDFKVCGTNAGITAMQMDIKIKGLDQGIMTKALEQARLARLHILEKMVESIDAPREKLSKHAPKIITLKINPDKIRDIIGPGGKTIRSLTEMHNVKIDIDDKGYVKIAGVDQDGIDGAIKIIKSLTEEAEIGKIYKGIVKRIADFGAFVEILPGVDGLVHISQLAEEKVRRVTDIMEEGDEVYVKVLEVDRQGKIRLSHKDALAEMGITQAPVEE